MVEASAMLSGLGFSPLNYVEMWAAAARTAQAASTPAANTAPFASATATSGSTSAARSASGSATASGASGTPFAGSEELPLQVQLEIARLKAAAQQALRNRAAQISAGGGYVSTGGSFVTTIGPDGQLYTTGVTLSYDTTPIADDPQATILKMQRVRAAALATTSPTTADLAAAAAATQAELRARLELVRQLAAQYLGAEDQQPAGALFSTLA